MRCDSRRFTRIAAAAGPQPRRRAVERKAVIPMGTFVIYIDHAGEYRWYLMANNNEKIADSSEGYKARADCEHGIQLVKRMASKSKVQTPAPRVETLIER
jgi:uncharacterized protein YegP (UPF0339 family)